MDYKEMLARARKLLEEAQAVYADPEADAEMQAAVESKDAQVAAAAAAEQKTAEEAKAGKAAPATEFKDWKDYLVACARAGMRDPTARYLDPRLDGLAQDGNSRGQTGPVG